MRPEKKIDMQKVARRSLEITICKSSPQFSEWVESSTWYMKIRASPGRGSRRSKLNQTAIAAERNSHRYVLCSTVECKHVS